MQFTSARCLAHSEASSATSWLRAQHRASAATCRPHSCCIVPCQSRRLRRARQHWPVRSQQQEDEGRPVETTTSPSFNWRVFKESIRPYFVWSTFAVGFMTLGLRTAADNFSLKTEPVDFFLSAITSAGILTAVVWVTFNFEQDPPDERRF